MRSLRYSRKQRRSLLALAIIILLLQIFSLFKDDLFKPAVPNADLIDQKMRVWINRSNQIKTDSLFHFDPNKASTGELEKLGLGQYSIKNFVKYREKGGKISEPEELLKIYGVDTLWYQKVKPYIVIDKSEKEVKKGGLLRKARKYNRRTDNNTESSSNKAAERLELNAADSVSLCKLRGIGPVFASRIIRYRALLGGYVEQQQLLEVYGMDQKRFEEISSQIWVDDAKVRKIDPNLSSFKAMLRHPYIDYELVKSICSYRESIGPFKETDELKNIELVNEVLFSKIAKYLTLESDSIQN